MTAADEVGTLPAPLLRQVSATPDEFLRCMRVARMGALTALGEGRWQLQGEGVTLEVELLPLAVRRIALLSLPQLQVRYRFVAGERATCEDFLRRLDRAMQRGGG